MFDYEVVNNQEEQDAIWAEIPNANITNSNTSAPDGGQASYLWIGSSDMGEEGKWEWIGESGEATQFWQGTNSGSAGEWKDLNIENPLYFIIEAEIDTSSGNGGGDGGDSGDGGGSDTTVAVTNYNIQSPLIYPNPSSSYLKLCVMISNN